MWFKGISTMLGHPCVPPKLVSDPLDQFMSEDLGLSTVALQKPCKYRHTFKNLESWLLMIIVMYRIVMKSFESTNHLRM